MPRRIGFHTDADDFSIGQYNHIALGVEFKQYLFSFSQKILIQFFPEPDFIFSANVNFLSSLSANMVYPPS